MHPPAGDRREGAPAGDGGGDRHREEQRLGGELGHADGAEGEIALEPGERDAVEVHQRDRGGHRREDAAEIGHGQGFGDGSAGGDQ